MSRFDVLIFISIRFSRCDRQLLVPEHDSQMLRILLITGVRQTPFRLSALRLSCASAVACLRPSDVPFSLCLRGDGEIRTHDPLLARQVLSQLSYTPIDPGLHLLSHFVSKAVPSAA